MTTARAFKGEVAANSTAGGQPKANLLGKSGRRCVCTRPASVRCAGGRGPDRLLRREHSRRARAGSCQEARGSDLSQNLSQNVFVSRQIFATTLAPVIRAADAAVAKLRSFATKHEK